MKKDKVEKKTCCDCKKEFPATRKYFYGHTKTKDHLNIRCKQCQNKLDEQIRKVAKIYLEKKYRRCWYCKLNGYDIINKYGCCKRCGTNLIKNTRYKRYPNMKNLDTEVLGYREKFDATSYNE